MSTAADPHAGVKFIRLDENGHELRAMRTCPTCQTIWEQVGVSEAYTERMSFGVKHSFLKFNCNIHPETKVAWMPRCPKCYGRIK